MRISIVLNYGPQTQNSLLVGLPYFLGRVRQEGLLAEARKNYAKMLAIIVDASTDKVAAVVAQRLSAIAPTRPNIEQTPLRLRIV